MRQTVRLGVQPVEPGKASPGSRPSLSRHPSEIASVVHSTAPPRPPENPYESEVRHASTAPGVSDLRALTLPARPVASSPEFGVSTALAWLAIWPTGRALADPDLPQARRTGAEEVKMAVLSTARFDVLWHFDFRDGNLGQRSAKNRATGVWPRTCGEKGTFSETRVWAARAYLVR